MKEMKREKQDRHHLVGSTHSGSSYGRDILWLASSSPNSRYDFFFTPYAEKFGVRAPRYSVLTC